MSHPYRITFRCFNRLTKKLHRHHAMARGTSRWSALRTWWKVERQWHNPCVQVLSVEPWHVGCPQVQYPTHWEYTCPFFRHAE